ncbi:MAG: ABC transporter permease subunit [Chloroflexota bacterium]|nr:MAG: ABC transporter permease subunit [Chloroflexota bacterium]
MFTEFKHTLRRLRGAIIGWGLGLFLYGLMMTYFFDSIATMDDLAGFLANYPEEMLAFFPSINEMFTPQGYMDTYFFSYMTLIIGIFTIGAAGNLLVGDEERGILDLLLAYPVSRSAFFWGRLLGFLAATALILFASWLGWLIPSGSTGLQLSAIELLRPFLPLFTVLVLFGASALLFSMLLPSGRTAIGLAGGLLVVSFLFVGLANLNSALEAIYAYTPLYYFQGGEAVAGLDWAKFLGLTAVAIVIVLLAWWRFQRREIRVGGEGGWKLLRFSAS